MLEGLARLKPVFATKGTVTAGNSSQTSDSSGGLILASERAIKTYDLKPLARFVSFAVRGVPPHHGHRADQGDPRGIEVRRPATGRRSAFELNEAFAAQALAVIETCKLDPAKVDPMGRAIALGPPVGRETARSVRPRPSARCGVTTAGTAWSRCASGTGRTAGCVERV